MKDKDHQAKSQRLEKGSGPRKPWAKRHNTLLSVHFVSSNLFIVSFHTPTGCYNYCGTLYTYSLCIYSQSWFNADSSFCILKHQARKRCQSISFIAEMCVLLWTISSSHSFLLSLQGDDDTGKGKKSRSEKGFYILFLFWPSFPFWSHNF
jgi:hypothetical protein